MKINKDFGSLKSKKKADVMKKGASTHQNSTGKYYSFENKGAYALVGNSSVGQYATKSVKGKINRESIVDFAQRLEKLCACNLHKLIETIGGAVCNITKLISPVLDVAFKIQSSIGSVNLKEVATTSSGMLRSSIYVNAKTSIYHTESDCT